MIKVKRVYDPPSARDGRRFLVDRLWPRGVKRDTLSLDDWLKNIAPSDTLPNAVTLRRRSDSRLQPAEKQVVPKACYHGATFFFQRARAALRARSRRCSGVRLAAGRS